MKSTAIALVIAVGAMAPLVANAAGDDLAQKSGCLNCHAVDTKKIGPAFKDVAAKYKGKSDDAMLAEWKAAKVHSGVKASDADVKAVLKWVSTLK